MDPRWHRVQQIGRIGRGIGSGLGAMATAYQAEKARQAEEERIKMQKIRIGAQLFKHFPNIYKRSLEFGIDITKDRIPVVPMTNTFIGDKPIFGISMLLFSIAVSLILGSVIGWIIALPAIRLRATYLMIVLITMADASQIFGRNVPAISGGTLGMFIPTVPMPAIRCVGRSHMGKSYHPNFL